MKERIEQRIQQLEQERNEVQIACAMRLKEIEGSIQALTDVLTAMDMDEKELAHVGS